MDEGEENFGNSEPEDLSELHNEEPDCMVFDYDEIEVQNEKEILTEDRWRSMKADETYNMFLSLQKRIDVLESAFNMMIEAEETKLKQLRLRLNK